MGIVFKSLIGRKRCRLCGGVIVDADDAARASDWGDDWPLIFCGGHNSRGHHDKGRRVPRAGR